MHSPITNDGDDEKRTSVTFYVTESLRNRARATYRSTSSLEHDQSWSDMINKALLAEVERREAAHNAGEEYPENHKPLAPGRPVGFWSRRPVNPRR